MMCSNNGWTAIVPIFHHVCKFEIPERLFTPSIKDNMAQFDRTTDPTARKMQSNISMGTYRPNGSLGIVNLA